MAEKVLALNRFLRLHYFGFSSLLVLLGAASVNPAPTGFELAVLVGIALSFHVFAYVQNDVLDLEVDRRQTLRAQDPLVRGDVRPARALAIALVQVPLSSGLLALVDAPPAAYAASLLGFLSMTVYNVFGKRCRLPPATDFVQGLAWGSLAIVGALVSGGITGRSLVVGAFGAGFIFLINGVHGGLRDLPNDLACGMRTTAIFLGARPVSETAARSTRPLQLFAFGAFALLLAPSAWLLVGERGAYGARSWWMVSATWLALQMISAGFLWHVVRAIEPRRDWIIGAHALPLLLPPVVVFLPLASKAVAILVVACFFAPFLAMDPALESPRRALSRALERARGRRRIAPGRERAAREPYPRSPSPKNA